jgi:heme/copper-type cytochrome/quinol oxidase subunit 2
MNMVSKNSKGEYTVDLHMSISIEKIIWAIVATVISIGIGVISFFLKASYQEIDVMKVDMKELPEKYVLKKDYKAEISEIKDTMKDNTSELKDSLKIIQDDIKKLLREKS